MKTIGFIGLGNMGLPMALHLCKAGFPLVVCSRNQESANTILRAGGTIASSYGEVAQRADVLITIVPADAEVLELYTSENGLIDHMKDGTICIDMTSAKGETKKIVAAYIKEKQRNIGIVDAPVSGGTIGAQAGTLTIMVGCEKALFDECMPIFEAMGKKMIHTGELGTASDIKMINQMLNAVHTSIACETICVAKKLNVDLQILLDVVNESSGSSFVTQNVAAKHLLTGDHAPGFRLNLMKKDVRLFTESARQENAFSPISELIYQIFTGAANRGYGNLNTTGVFNWFDENQGD